MVTETAPWDAAEHLDTDEAIAEFVTAALETGDPAFIAHSLGVAARARGMTHIARSAGLSRESLYRALSETGNPSFDTVLRVARSLGVQFVAQPAGEHDAAA